VTREGAAELRRRRGGKASRRACCGLIRLLWPIPERPMDLARRGERHG